METALENPLIVGAHWFKLYDESMANTDYNDGQNYQIGLLDICDQPYSETIEAARQVAAEMYKLRSEGTDTRRSTTAHLSSGKQ